MKELRKPQIRFAGFTDDWEQRKLGEITENLDNQRIPVAESLRKTGTTPYYGANGIQGYIDGFTHNGEFVLIAEDGANDLQNYPVQYVTGKVWVNNHAHVVAGKINTLDNLFLTYRIKSMDISRFLVGGGRAKLNASTMKEIEIKYPTLPEQTAIGAFFKQLDETIALHQREYEKYKNLKISYLEKMFPKENEQFPELRFPEFTDAWEQRKLGEIVEIIGGGTPDTTNENYWNGSIDWYSPTEIGNNVYAIKSEKTITKLGLEKSSAKLLPANKTILFTSRASIGDMAILKNQGSTNQGFQSFVVGENLDIYFLYSMGYKIKEFALKNASGSTFLEISKNQLALCPISLPSKQEQTAIGNFFKQLDETIALHQRELEKYKKIKQSYLEKMFV